MAGGICRLSRDAPQRHGELGNAKSVESGPGVTRLGQLRDAEGKGTGDDSALTDMNLQRQKARMGPRPETAFACAGGCTPLARLWPGAQVVGVGLSPGSSPKPRGRDTSTTRPRGVLGPFTRAGGFVRLFGGFSSLSPAPRPRGSAFRGGSDRAGCPPTSDLRLPLFRAEGRRVPHVPSAADLYRPGVLLSLGVLRRGPR